MYSSVANFAVFPQIWACFFVKLRVISRLACCLFYLKFACFLQICVLQIPFLSNFMALLKFQFTAKGNLGVFL